MALTTIFMSVTIQLGLPQGLIDSICYIESKHNTAAYVELDGQTPSYGVCMIKLETAQWLGFKGTEEELMQPKVNVYYAGLYLKHQLRRYNDISRAVIAYNQGHAGQLTTTNYQRIVFKQWGKYENN